MSELENHITRINNKLQQLLKEHASLQKENAGKTKEIKALKELKEVHSKRIRELEQQVLILKSANNQLSDSDKTAFEKNITQYIKEIDKCITLLSE